MKRKISNLLVAGVFLGASVAFSACDLFSNGLGLNGQVPVYQGMTISQVETVNSASVTAMTYSSGIIPMGSENGNKDNNGKHNGWYKGDSTDKDETIDEENPYPDNSENENIETEIKDSLEVVGSEKSIYYASLNEKIYINIHINFR